MIKVNVEVDNKSWRKRIKNPKIYLNKRLKFYDTYYSSKSIEHDIGYFILNNKEKRQVIIMS